MPISNTLEHVKSSYPSELPAGQELQLPLFTTSKEPVDIEIPIIKIEANLAALPFFALSRKDAARRTELIHRVYSEKGEGTWHVIASPKYGFPTPFDRKVFKAVEHLINQRGFPVQNPLRFSLYEIAVLLGNYRNSGRTYKMIRQSLRRIVQTGVDTAGIFYSKPHKTFISDSFHIYERVVFKNQALPDGDIAETNYLFLGSWYLANLNAFYVRPIDFRFYRSLKSDIAGKLYELAGLKFYGVLSHQGEYWRPTYEELCELLPVTRQQFFSKAKDQLKIAHEELINSQFFTMVEWEAGVPWHIRYYPGPKAIEDFRRHREFLESPNEIKQIQELPTIDQSLIDSLAERGVSKNKAKKLVEEYGDQVREKIEIFDWLREEKSELIKSNPQGYLVKMIEENWTAPEGFKSKAQREEEESRRERREKEREFEEWLAMTPEEKISGNLWVWERNLRKEGKTPSLEEIEAKKKELIDKLPTIAEHRRWLFKEK